MFQANKFYEIISICSKLNEGSFDAFKTTNFQTVDTLLTFNLDFFVIIGSKMKKQVAEFFSTIVWGRYDFEVRDLVDRVKLCQASYLKYSPTSIL